MLPAQQCFHRNHCASGRSNNGLEIQTELATGEGLVKIISDAQPGRDLHLHLLPGIDDGPRDLESSVRMARALLIDGIERVAVSPHVSERFIPSGVSRAELTADELKRADVVVMLVDHSEFDLALVASTATHILDTRHCMAGANVEFL